MKLLPVCAALAAGEALALGASLSSRMWPFFAVIAAIVALIGFGRRLRFYRLIAVFFAGSALALGSSRAYETDLRDNPWMRERRARRMVSDENSFVSRVRRDISRRIGIGLEHSPETAELNRAILLGERSKLSRETKKTFIESGTMHLFAVSGFHVMIIAQTILIALLIMSLPFRIAPLVAIPVLWGYVWVIDFPPSAVRAAAMASFYLASPVFWRKCDPLHAWSLTFILVHTISPRMLFNTGNLLSFTVMLSILLWLRVAPRRFSAISVTFAAWAAGMPIAARVFERVTPGGLIANLFAMPLAGVSVTGGTLGAVTSCISERLAAHLNNLAALATGIMTTLTRAVAALPFSDIDVPKWTITQCALWYAALALGYLLALVVRKRRRSL